ncbi:MAG: FAD-binding protein [Oscillospiraceae bacterium]|nr:FAD-binding protein [Oscillospiraceae bacterium]
MDIFMNDLYVSGYHRHSGLEIPIYRFNTVVVGSGAAGLNAADSLRTQTELNAHEPQTTQEPLNTHTELNVPTSPRESDLPGKPGNWGDVAIITEDVMAGTSRNAGSDKQTYYKLALGGGGTSGGTGGSDDGGGDSVAQMARTLFEGGCVDGDIAMSEAGLSAECFFKLVALGVPFPRDRYGAWTGYKTDHDPRCRATSAGPYTSRLMTEKLYKAVELKGIPIFGGMLAISILKRGEEAIGVLCLDVAEAERGRAAYAAFCCKNVIIATGGPAGIYKDTVYPAGHHGANGLAFEAGALGANLTEWQYGLASTNPRWNVSGTYMQALPRFISVAADGSGEREFLADYFANEAELLTNVFLKGYQWPFDAQKVFGGSSLIDLCVFCEQQKGRRVMLDYRDNPFGKAVDFAALGSEARAYLERAGACFGSPLDRLAHMNMPAVEFYRDHGADLAKGPLEIALCAQHNNGGIAVDRWWRTRVEGLFAVGEAAATHGVRRPGGSALNAGQAGALRAAQYIAARRGGPPPDICAFTAAAEGQIASALCVPYKGDLSPIINNMRASMSKTAGAIRNIYGMQSLLGHAGHIYRSLDIGAWAPARVANAFELLHVYTLRELCISQIMYLSAFIDYAQKGGKSRGGAIFTDAGGAKPHEKLPDSFALSPDSGEFHNMVQEIEFDSAVSAGTPAWREVRPLPDGDDFFEDIWRDFRAGKHIDE